MNKWMVGLVAFVFLLALTGCGRSSPSRSHELPTPTPPTQLQFLPQQASVVCTSDVSGTGPVNVWELPGTEPSDPNSAYQGNRGRLLGEVEECTKVTILAYAWSRTDQEFWVRILTPTGLEGWVSLSMVDLAPS